MPAFLVTGYKTMDLGIFSDKDPRLTIIKKAIRKDLIRLFDEGVDWLVFQGNLGFESWCLDVALELSNDYEIKLGCIFPFADHGKNWNDSNQVTLAKFRQLDYVHHSFTTYENPSQLRQHQDFLIRNTQGVYLFYDTENETALRYFYQAAKEQENYDIRRLDFDRLNDIAQEDH